MCAPQSFAICGRYSGCGTRLFVDNIFW